MFQRMITVRRTRTSSIAVVRWRPLMQYLRPPSPRPTWMTGFHLSPLDNLDQAVAHSSRLRSAQSRPPHTRRARRPWGDPARRRGRRIDARLPPSPKFRWFVRLASCSTSA
jgi:hypothetical protein